MINLATKSWVKELVAKVVAKHKGGADFGNDIIGYYSDGLPITADVQKDGVGKLVSVNGTASCSSIYSPSYGANCAFDEGSYGWFPQNTMSTGSWLQYLFKERTSATKIQIQAINSYGFTLNIQYAESDNDDWKDLGTIYINNGLNEFACKNVVFMKKIRITVTTTNNTSTGSGIKLKVYSDKVQRYKLTLVASY